jgi:hypothetical protein
MDALGLPRNIDFTEAYFTNIRNHGRVRAIVDSLFLAAKRQFMNAFAKSYITEVHGDGTT